MIFIVSLFCESNFPSWHFDDVRLNKKFFLQQTHHPPILYVYIFATLFLLSQSTYILKVFFYTSFSRFIAANNLHIFILYRILSYAEVDTRNMFSLSFIHLYAMYTYSMLRLWVLLNNTCYYRSTFPLLTWMNKLLVNLRFIHCRKSGIRDLLCQFFIDFVLLFGDNFI